MPQHFQTALEDIHVLLSTLSYYLCSQTKGGPPGKNRFLAPDPYCVRRMLNVREVECSNSITIEYNIVIGSCSPIVAADAERCVFVILGLLIYNKYQSIAPTIERKFDTAASHPGLGL